MIFDFIIAFYYTLITTILDPLPNIPDFPAVVQNSIDYIFGMVEQTLNILYYFIGREFLIGFSIIALAIVLFENIYHFIMYIIRKIPFVNIS